MLPVESKCCKESKLFFFNFFSHVDLLNDFVRFGNAAPSSAKAEEKPGMNTEPSGTFPLTNDYHTRGRGGFRNRGNRQYNWK